MNYKKTLKYFLLGSVAHKTFRLCFQNNLKYEFTKNISVRP